MTEGQMEAYRALMEACERYVAWFRTKSTVPSEIYTIRERIRTAVDGAYAANEAAYHAHQEQVRAARKADVMLFDDIRSES